MSPTSHPCQTEGRDDLAAGVGVPAEALLAMFQTSGLAIEESRLLGFEKTYFILQSSPKYDTSNSLYVVRVQNYISLQNMYIYALYI